MEVAVAFGDLRPEFSSDLYHRLYPGTVNFNRVHLLAGSVQGVQVVLAPHVLVPLAEHVEGVAQDFVLFDFGLEPLRSALFDFERLAVAQVFAQAIHHLAEHAIGLAFIGFEGTDLVDQIVDHIAEVHGVQHAEAEVNRELQSWLAGSGFDSVTVFEQENAKAVETGILQGEAVFGFVHAETAGAA